MAQIHYIGQMKAFTPCGQNYEWGSVVDPGSLKGGGGKLWGVRGHPPPEKISKFMMFSRPIYLNLCQHPTTRRDMNVNVLSSISKTKVPTQGDTSAAAVAIAVDVHYYAMTSFNKPQNGHFFTACQPSKVTISILFLIAPVSAESEVYR